MTKLLVKIQLHQISTSFSQSRSDMVIGYFMWSGVTTYQVVLVGEVIFMGFHQWHGFKALRNFVTLSN